MASSSESWTTPGTSLSTAPLPLNVSRDGVWAEFSAGDWFVEDVAGAEVGIWAAEESTARKTNDAIRAACIVLILFIPLPYRFLDAYTFIASGSGILFPDCLLKTFH